MDSVTHILIGGAIGNAIAGKKLGRHAIWLGALAKTAPDFDVFFTSQKNPISYICNHRAYSHALPIQLLAACIIAYICNAITKKKHGYTMWFALWLVCFWCHSLLDTCTNFGTRLLLPFSKTAFSTYTISVADLFYTIPLLVLFTILCIAKNNSILRLRTTQILLGYAVLYVTATFVNKNMFEKKFIQSLQAQHIAYNHFISNPVILNNFMWYGMARNDSTIFISEHTLFDNTKAIHWSVYPMQRSLLDSFDDCNKQVEVLNWFSNGYTLARRDKDTLLYYAIKFGRTNLDSMLTDKETFGFYYKLYKDSTGNCVMGFNDYNNFSFATAWKKLWKGVFCY